MASKTPRRPRPSQTAGGLPAGLRRLSRRSFQPNARLLVARRWFAVAVLVLVGLLYYRPLHNYFASRAQRAQRLDEVAKLERQQAALKRKLNAAKSEAALAAEERLLGFIHPGEHLFIVKDIQQWRRRQNHPRRGR